MWESCVIKAEKTFVQILCKKSSLLCCSHVTTFLHFLSFSYQKKAR